MCSSVAFHLEKTLCKQSLKSLNERLFQIRSKFSSFIDLIDHKRYRRGIVNGVGTLFKTLFGTMDNNDALYYNDAINRVILDNRHFKNLLRDQTQVLQNTLKTFNDSILEYNSAQQTLNQNIQIFNNYSNVITNLTDALELSQSVTNHMMLLSQLVGTMDNEINSLILVVLFAQKNQIHPFIITPKQFITELYSTIAYLPNSRKYPLPVTIENGHELMSLVDLKLFYIDLKLIYVISVPLIFDTNFNLFHLMPIPIQHKTLNSTYIFIQPQTNYIVLSSNRLQYLIQENLDNCKNPIGNLRICKQNYVLYNVHDHPICETELIFGSKTIPNSCKVYIVHGNLNIWHKLQISNQWIYILSNLHTLTVSCNNNPNVNLYLKGVGILTLTKSCKAFSNSIMLHPSESYHSEYESICPTIDIANDNCCNSFEVNHTIQKYTLLKTKTSNQITTHNLDSLSVQLDTLHKQIVSSETVPLLVKHSTLHQVVIYVICSIVLILLLGKLYKLKIYSKCIAKPIATEDIELQSKNMDHPVTELCRTAPQRSENPSCVSVVHQSVKPGQHLKTTF